MSTKEMLEMEKSKLQTEMVYQEKNLVLAYALWFFLGTLGAHRFYLGKIKTAVTYLVIALFGWILVGIPYIALGIWWLIDAYYVNKYVIEHNNDMKVKKLEVLDNQIQEKDNEVVENSETVEAVKEIQS